MRAASTPARVDRSQASGTRGARRVGPITRAVADVDIAPIVRARARDPPLPTRRVAHPSTPAAGLAPTARVVDAVVKRLGRRPCPVGRRRRPWWRERASALEDLPGETRGLARRLADLDAGRLESDLLGLGGTRRAGDDGARVAHGLALGGGEAGDVP